MTATAREQAENAKRIFSAGDSVATDVYRDGFKRMWQLVNLLAAVIFFFLALFLYTLYTHQPQDSYYAEMADNRRMQVVGLDMPNINNETLFQWAAESATQIMTFGFNDYENKLSAASERFTTPGWEEFRTKMIDSSFFKTVLEAQQIVTAVPFQPPTLFSEGVEKGKYTWVVEVPLLMTIRSGDKNQSSVLKVRLVIVRVPTAEIPTGLGIDRWTSS